MATCRVNGHLSYSGRTPGFHVISKVYRQQYRGATLRQVRGLGNREDDSSVKDDVGAYYHATRKVLRHRSSGGKLLLFQPVIERLVRR